jgi:hypothetical protein
MADIITTGILPLHDRAPDAFNLLIIKVMRPERDLVEMIS